MGEAKARKGLWRHRWMDYYEEHVTSEGISYSIQNIAHMLHPHDVS